MTRAGRRSRLETSKLNATFTVALFTSRVAPRKADFVSAGAFWMNARVLVVDDEVHLAAAAAQRLTDEGFKVDVAHDGEEGLEKLVAGAYDVVVTDVSMPILSGPEMLNRAQAQSGTLQRCVIVGGYAPDAASVKGLEHACWMVRPVSLPDLVAAVKAQLS